jgi:O-antigen/teichoic acid export membrane protein
VVRVCNGRTASNCDGQVNAIIQARSHAKRAAWAVADQGINPLVQLAITPYLLGRLGKEDFGIWVLAITLVSMSQLVSCGAGIAATKHVSADLGVGAKSEAIATTRAALTIAILGGACAAVFAWVLAGPIVAAFFAHMGKPEHIAPIVALCGLAAAIQEIDNVYTGALRGAERFDLCAKTEVPTRLVMGAIIVLLSWRVASVYTMFVGLMIMMTFKAALKATQVAILFKSATCYFPSFVRASLARVFRFGVWQWLQSAGSVLFTATDQLLIGSLLGATSLTRYSVCLQIAQYVHMLPSVMMQVIFPRVSALGSALDPRRGNEILRSVTVLAISIALMLGLPVIVFAYPLLRVWIGADFAADNYLLLIVLAVVHIALAVNIGGYFVLLGSGRSARSAGIVLAAGAAQSAFAIVIAPFGILAVACNRFLYALLTSFLYRAARFKTHD